MDFTQYQRDAARTENKMLSENEQLVCAAIGIFSEGGEFAGEVKKWRYQGHDFDRVKAEKELGDVLWYLSLAASAMGISLECIAEGNIAKLRERYPGDFSPAASINRTG
jgi:NTP pyrophosphatase (non-canonical NTP hydrolase)